MTPDPQSRDSDYAEIAARLERIQPKPTERFYRHMANAPWAKPYRERSRSMRRPLVKLAGVLGFGILILMGTALFVLQQRPAPTTPLVFPIVDLPPLSTWQLSEAARQYYTTEVRRSIFTRHEIGSLTSLTDEPFGLGMWAQEIPAAAYRGQRLRYSGVVQTANVEKWAGLWMKIEDEQGQLLGFDFMQSRPIHGTQTWASNEVVLDVPQAGVTIAFGVLLDGRGQVEIKEVLMEIVDARVATTNWGPPRPQPVGLDFESDTFAWGLTGANLYDYAYKTDTSVVYEGNQSGHLYAYTGTPKDSAATGQGIQANLYLNRRLRLSGYLKTIEVEEGAGLWLRADDARGRMLSFANMEGRPVMGTTGWQLYSVVIEIPPTSSMISFGVWLEGKGEVWMDSFQLEVVE